MAKQKNMSNKTLIQRVDEAAEVGTKIEALLHGRNPLAAFYVLESTDIPTKEPLYAGIAGYLSEIRMGGEKESLPGREISSRLIEYCKDKSGYFKKNR